METSNTYVIKRSRLFFELLKTRLGSLVLVSLFSFLFLIPFVFFNLYVSFSPLSELDKLFNLVTVFLINALLIAIFSYGLAGLFYFTKRLIWGQGANARRDYFVGVKENGKMFFIAGLVFGLVYAVGKIGVGTLTVMGEELGILSTIMIGLIYLAIFLFLIITLYIFAQTTIYQGGYFALLKNAIKYSFGRIIYNLLIVFFGTLPLIAYDLIPNVFVEYISLIIYFVFYIGVFVLLFSLYAHSLFDKTINYNLYPEILNKGLIVDKNK